MNTDELAHGARDHAGHDEHGAHGEQETHDAHDEHTHAEQETTGATSGYGGHADASGASGEWLAFTPGDAAVLLALAAVLAGYVLLVRRSAGVSSRSAFVFVAGLVVVFAGVSSTFGALRAGSHLGYMLQLELLMSFAPPLLLIGLAPLAGRLARSGSAPVLALGLWLLVIYLWHLPSLHMAGMMGAYPGPIYAAQLASYLAGGLLFWWPVIGGSEMRPLGKLGYLAAAQAGVAALAAVLIFHPRLLYAHGAVTEPFGLPAMLDQRVSGAAMMVLDMAVASTVASWIVLGALANGDQLSLRGSGSAGRLRSRVWRVCVPLAVVALGVGLVLGSAPPLQASGDAPSRVSLAPAQGSGVSGEAVFTETAEGVEVELRAQGLPDAGETYQAHLHPGSCAGDPAGSSHGHGGVGEVEHPIEPLVTGADGAASSVTTVQDATLARLFSGGATHGAVAGVKGVPGTEELDLVEALLGKSRPGPTPPGLPGGR